MTDRAPAGTVVSAGKYRCSNCGYVINIDSSQSLPPCPSCGGPDIAHGWEPLSGDDPEDDSQS